MLRLGSWLRLAMSVVVLVGVGHALPPVMTTVSDTVYRADGSAASGTMLISWPAFTTADAKPVAAAANQCGLLHVRAGHVPDPSLLHRPATAWLGGPAQVGVGQ